MDIWSVIGPLAGVLPGGVMRDISKLFASVRREARRQRQSMEATAAIVDTMVGHAARMLEWAEFDNSGSSIQRLRPIDQEAAAISDQQRGKVSRIDQGTKAVQAYERCLLAYRGGMPNSVNSDVQGLRQANDGLTQATHDWHHQLRTRRGGASVARH